MRSATTSSVTTIAGKPGEIFDFVTDPRNWVGNHPATAAVTEASAAVGVAGESWIEVIHMPGGATHDARWLATTAVPGHTWVIETGDFIFGGARCQIVYTFTEQAEGTRFRRDMTVLIPEEVVAANEVAVTEFLAAMKDPSVHDRYLSNVKDAIEA